MRKPRGGSSESERERCGPLLTGVCAGFPVGWTGPRSNTNRRAGAEEVEMNTRHSPRIRRVTVEQLLNGGPATVPDPLARLLAGAAAPPQPGELAREDMAVAACHAARLSPVTASRRGQMVTPPLARFLMTKIAARAARHLPKPAARGRAGGAATAGPPAVPVTGLCLALTTQAHAILTGRAG